MSESTLYHAFKEVTRMSPVQYQKKLRLHEARKLMLLEGLEASTASYKVGYESPSHFSREYSRMFGSPPRTDVAKLRRGERNLAAAASYTRAAYVKPERAESCTDLALVS